MGLNIGVSFQIPMLLQFVILFVYSNRQLNFHLRIASMDQF